jgi:magnesium chelatase family protein
MDSRFSLSLSQEGENNTMADLTEQPLTSLLQALHYRATREPLTTDEQRALMQTLTDLLIACGKQGARPLPGQDMQEVRGHNHVKRVLEVAAAGGHHVLLSGPPHAGKSLLARTLPSILPEVAVPYPLRAPDATIQPAAFIGDATTPGELTLAHGGVLLLAHLHAFDPMCLTALCRAVETRVVTIPNGEASLLFPANMLLIATMLPCPCGFYSDSVQACTCSPETILQHHQRLQEAIAGCFDLHVEVPIIRENLMKMPPEESSATIRKRVEAAREQQQKRYVDSNTLWVNADIRSVDEVQRYCQMDAPAERLLSAARAQLHLTPLQNIRIHRVARTIANLAGAEMIAANHLAEAISYLPHLGR